MKLNATAEMLPITWPAFSGCTPSLRGPGGGVRPDLQELEAMCRDHWISRSLLQPNSGAQGEYAGLQVIKAYTIRAASAPQRLPDPQSAHEPTPLRAMVNYPASWAVKTDENGNVDVKDLEAKAAQSANNWPP